MDISRRKYLVESLIFASGEPVGIDRLMKLLEAERFEIRDDLQELAAEYETRNGGIRLYEVAGGYQFRTAPEYAEEIRQLSGDRVVKFSQAALESLAIIAYRQPITKADIEYLRGVDSGGVLKTLLERRLIKIVGRKDVPGRPILYGTTKEFLEHFSLRGLNELPTLKEFAELTVTTPDEMAGHQHTLINLDEEVSGE